MRRFTFVTYAGMPDLDPDDRLALDLLARRGFDVATAVWDDAMVDWARAGIVIIRSTWDYNHRHADFLSWAESVASVTPLYNPISLVRWNLHKGYLADLAARGVPIVPTLWLGKGSTRSLASVLDERGWQTAVVKPGIGLSTYGVRKVTGTADDQVHVEHLLRSHDVMVQPYMRAVDERGERSLMFIGGVYSHAARKTAFQALLPTGEAGETPADATDTEIAVATKALRALPASPLYARADLVDDDEGQPLVIEFELIEPTLFLSMHPGAAERFADALSELAA